MLVVFLGGSLMAWQLPDFGWNLHPENQLINGWARWDSGWYLDIAANGYGVSTGFFDQRNIVFFPLYPILIRIVSFAIADRAWAGFLISNTAFAVALIALYDMTKSAYGVGTARWTVRLLATFPFAFYLSAVYSESVFLLTVVGAFFFAGRRQWAAAAFCAALASATRPYGVIVGLGLAVEYLKQRGFRMREVRADALWLLIAPAGLALYAGYLGWAFGDPVIFLKARAVAGWDTTVFGDRALTVLSNPPLLSDILAGRYLLGDAMHILTIMIAGIALARARRQLAPGVWIWTVLTLLVIIVIGWAGAGRYVLPLFPVFVAIALSVRQPATLRAIVMINTLLMAMYALMFSHWDWIS